MPPARDDLRLLLFAGAAVVLAGVAITVLLLVSTNRGGGPPKQYEPFEAGLASAIEGSVRDEGPYYYADPYGGDDSLVFTLEHGDVVALAVNQSDLPGCAVQWKDQLDRFVCGDRRFSSEQLERFEVTVPDAGPDKGLLIIDVRTRLPAPVMKAG